MFPCVNVFFMIFFLLELTSKCSRYISDHFSREMEVQIIYTVCTRTMYAGPSAFLKLLHVFFSKHFLLIQTWIIALKLTYYWKNLSDTTYSLFWKSTFTLTVQYQSVILLFDLQVRVKAGWLVEACGYIRQWLVLSVTELEVDDPSRMDHSFPWEENLGFPL